MIKLFTIGFTKKSAEQFFTTLQQAGVRRLIDTRLNNNHVRSLAGGSDANGDRWQPDPATAQRRRPIGCQQDGHRNGRRARFAPDHGNEVAVVRPGVPGSSEPGAGRILGGAARGRLRSLIPDALDVLADARNTLMHFMDFQAAVAILRLAESPTRP
jgi:hypothetical protein